MTRPLPETQPLSENVYVAGQLQPEDVAELATCGVTTIVNNRPDGEEDGQPASDAIEAAAWIAGMDYRHIPIESTFSEEKVAAMGEALASARGNVVIFCKSGTRSTYLWALARARQGADVDEMLFHATRAGYNLRPLLPWLKGAAQS
ncbi:MAG: TIGR01244 family phosphatase [Sphingomonadaceae bacterium]|nr:TIGR01244 family phosphatase [Sphingomonadaceae bacterium]